jgi:hypothetical protein
MAREESNVAVSQRFLGAKKRGIQGLGFLGSGKSISVPDSGIG